MRFPRFCTPLLVWTLVNVAECCAPTHVSRNTSNTRKIGTPSRAETRAWTTIFTSEIQGRRIDGCAREVNTGEREGDEKINDEEFDDTINRSYQEVVEPQDPLLSETARTRVTAALSRQCGSVSQEIKSVREGTEKSTLF